MPKSSLPLFSWDGKNKKILVGPSAVALVLGIIYAYLAMHGVYLGSSMWNLVSTWWK
jgi:hypothetical protein